MSSKSFDKRGAITVACPSCRTNVKASETYAGRTAKCPKCQASITIPAAHPGVSLSSEQSATQTTSTPARHHKRTKPAANNIGTRQDSLRKAEMYWTARSMKTDKEPYLLYSFPNEEAARKALLAVPCIYEASDSDELVCTGPLTFGFYEAEENHYEAIIAGWALTPELFHTARTRFREHGGKPRGEGELAPTDRQPVTPDAPPAPPVSIWKWLFVPFAGSAKGDANVRFVKKYKKPTVLGTKCTYEVYEGPNEQVAIAFLKSKPVSKPFYYLIVETPQGNWAQDKDGMYKE